MADHLRVIEDSILDQLSVLWIDWCRYELFEHRLADHLLLNQSVARSKLLNLAYLTTMLSEHLVLVFYYLSHLRYFLSESLCWLTVFRYCFIDLFKLSLVKLYLLSA